MKDCKTCAYNYTNRGESDSCYHIVGSCANFDKWEEEVNDTTVYGRGDTPEQRVRDYVTYGALGKTCMHCGKDHVGYCDDFPAMTYGDGEETTDGLKYDVHKTDMTFLADWGLALEEICKLSAFGAEKYSRGGWTEITDPERLKACMLRHYFKEKTGEPDPDSGVMHDVAVAWNALSALQIRLQNDKQ